MTPTDREARIGIVERALQAARGGEPVERTAERIVDALDGRPREAQFIDKTPDERATLAPEDIRALD